MRVAAVTDIDAAALRKQGFEALLLDLDNTLLPWMDPNVPKWSRQWIESAKQAGMKACLVSNTHYPRRLNRIAAELGVPAVAHSLKPRRHGFEKAAALIGCELERAVVIGDQLLTDIWGGNRVGAYTILVNPIHPREFVGTKVSRMVERVIFALLRLPARQGTNG
jgi:HAD superfamily phosphatase (TIGR01668 family)